MRLIDFRSDIIINRGPIWLWLSMMQREAEVYLEKTNTYTMTLAKQCILPAKPLYHIILRGLYFLLSFRQTAVCVIWTPFAPNRLPSYKKLFYIYLSIYIYSKNKNFSHPPHRRLGPLQCSWKDRIGVCMYVCMNVWMYECMNVCMYVCMHARMYACMHVCMHVYICVYVYVYVYVWMYGCMDD